MISDLEVVNFLESIQNKKVYEDEIYHSTELVGRGDLVFPEHKDYVIEKAIETVRKQIPKKSEFNEFNSLVCPKCHAIAYVKEDTPAWMTSGYCFRCGQKLIWNNDEKSVSKDGE